jgi:RNA polymerase sigma-70 factor (ECF subfamily)
MRKSNGLRSVPAGSSDEPPASLADLMAAVARGDTRAFEVLYDRTSTAVYGTVLRVLRDRAQSEEVTQEVMVEVWRHAGRFDENRGSVMSWILTMTHRRAVDRVRAEQSATNRRQRLGGRDIMPAFDEVSEAVTARLEVEAVRSCLSSLTELQRQAVELAYYQGYSYREVAELLEVPLGTVKTRMRDGLIRLRDCLGVTT